MHCTFWLPHFKKQYCRIENEYRKWYYFTSKAMRQTHKIFEVLGIQAARSGLQKFTWPSQGGKDLFVSLLCHLPIVVVWIFVAQIALRLRVCMCFTLKKACKNYDGRCIVVIPRNRTTIDSGQSFFHRTLCCGFLKLWYNSPAFILYLFMVGFTQPS